MLDAIHAAKLVMLTDQLQMQTISHNISNLQTPGYKRQILSSPRFDEQLEINSALLSQQMTTQALPEQGTLVRTDNTNDLAIVGEGFFQLQNESGLFYSRRGDFHINQQGQLVNEKEALLMGQNGPIVVSDQVFTIDHQGNVFIEGHKVDQISLVKFDHPNLLNPVGDGLYQSSEFTNPAASPSEVRQGFIEQSNVKSVDEMTEIIKTANHFASAQRLMRVSDNLLAVAINQLGEGNV